MSALDQPTVGQDGIVSRPADQLHDLPVRFRWEVTRRHPYYLTFWSNALLYRQGLLGSHPAEATLRYAATLMLGAIGVTGEPVGPRTEFEELDAVALDPAFLSGAVQPMTIRAMVAMLIGMLPAAERAAVGAIFLTSGDREYAIEGDDATCSSQQRNSLARLARIASRTLDSCPDAPLFYLHLGASQRTIVRDVEEQSRRWKRRRGIPERRVPVQKLPSYLEVWDLREGWTGGGYERSREKTFAQVARRLKEPLSTVATRYGSAFQMITGHSFAPELWWRLFGPLKASSVFGDATASLSRPLRRHFGRSVERPVPEAVLNPVADQAHATGLVERETAELGDQDLVDLRLDLEELIRQGLSDEEIAERLEIGDLTLVAYLRERSEEFRAL